MPPKEDPEATALKAELTGIFAKFKVKIIFIIGLLLFREKQNKMTFPN